MKRAFDFVAGASLLVGLSPIMALLGLLVRAGSPGPALHRATRVGRNGTAFTIYKLRTMRHDPASAGPGITASGDPRITPLGAFLRGTRLDELPQLWNVVRGDMSLVGPRPEDPRFVAAYTREQREVLSVRPGITGPSQLAHLDEERLLPGDDVEAAYVRDVLPRKIAIDLAYVRGRSFVGDLVILGRTLVAPLRRHPVVQSESRFR